MPELLTAVKLFAGSPVEIAAASVGETSLVKAVRKIEGDGKGLDFTLEVVEPEVLEATTEVVAKEAEEATVANEEELTSAEADPEAPAAEETSAPVAAAAAVVVEEEEVAASLSEEPITSALTVEEVGEVESEDQAAVPAAAPEEAVSSTDTSPEDTAPAEEATPVEEATPAEEDTPAEEATPAAEAVPVDEITPAAETSVEDAEASTAEAVEALATTHSEAAAVVDTAQLAAASSGSDLEVLSAAEPAATSEAPVQEAKHCHSCHSAPSAAEEVAPPAAFGVQLAGEEVVDITQEVKEAVFLVEGQKPKVSNWTVKSCSVM